MATQKKKNPKKVTPRGVAKFPKLVQADYKFNKTGEWVTKLALDPSNPETQPFLDYLDAEVDKAVEQMKKEHPKYASKIVRVPAYIDEVDKEGKETGMIELNFKRPCIIDVENGPNAGKQYKLTPPVLYDGMGTPITNPELKLGAGSVLKVSFEHWPYFSAKDKQVGITRRLLAAQVLKLVEWGEKDAASFGFGVEESEFSASEPDETDETEETTPATKSDAGDF